MPAAVDKMFSYRHVPWHINESGERTTVLEDFPQTWAAARTLAGLDWDPVSEPVVEWIKTEPEVRAEFEALMADGHIPTVDEIMQIVEDADREVPGYQRIVRSDNGETLSVNNQTYEIITNSDFGEILTAVLEQDNIRLETGGCLEGGRRVWMSALMDHPIEIPGDHTMVLPRLAIMARHDGRGSAALRALATRIVCGNTWTAGEMEGERTGYTYSFIHRGDWRKRLEEAREAVMKGRKEIADYIELATDLLGIKVTPRQTELFITEFIPMPPEGLISDRVARNIELSRQAIRDIIASPTVEGAGIAGTAHGLVQAAGEYLDYVREAKTWETRVKRTLLRPEPLKYRATKLAREVALA